MFLGFPGGSAGKESACSVGDLGLIPGLGRSPGEGNSYPLQYSGLENSMDCKVHGVSKSQTRLRGFHFHCSFNCVWIQPRTRQMSSMYSRGLESIFWHGPQTLIKRIPQVSFQEVTHCRMEDRVCRGPERRILNFSWGQRGLPCMCKSER